MGVKVSVVMPVSNPGLSNDAFGACVRSVLEQSLPPEEYEVIFADDGSTDGTRRRLDAIAGQRDNVRVLHLDHSGSPARGRNVGLSVARGEYVYLLGQYDRLEPRALEVMYDRAVETDADVLIGRLASQGPPAAAFARDRDRADVLRDHLLALPTAHKLFSRDFLETCQLRFADRPLSEQAFVTRAYLAAKVIAVLAGEICCHLAPASAGTAAEEEGPDGEALFDGLNAVFDVVDAYTEPGSQRERIHAHWYRTLGLRRLAGARFLAAEPDERMVLFSFLRRFTLDRFPAALDVHLPAHLRARTALLRQDRLDALVALAEASRGTRLSAELRELRWDQGVLLLDLSVEILRAGGAPVWLRQRDDRLLWAPPPSVEGLLDGLLDDEGADMTDAVRRARVEVCVRHVETGVVHSLPVTCSVGRAGLGDRAGGGQVRVWVSGQARLDAGAAALGRPLPAGLWEVHVRMRGVQAGRTRVARPALPMSCAGALAGEPRRLVVPCWSEHGELGVCVEPKSFPESIALVSSRATVARQEGHVFVVVPVPYVPPSGGPPAELVLREQDGRGRSMVVPALVEPGIPGRVAGQLVARVPVSRIGGDDCLGPGSWRPALRVDQKDVDLLFGLAVRRGGQVSVLPAGASPQAPSLLRRIAVRVLRDRR
ncbi:MULTISPECIES: glycosyltransferase family 2 protein [unclassified Microbispora]|uniref:glycosyltransferase family 2 protein n=1 Tax=unclassified Microbispora TaxID=2614687 RepID=UPI0014764694|nr:MULTISPECIES: glycosyltransferase family 2 protein [unclassified Microbispora]